ncbi:hypothetical protein IDH10_01545 [Pelagibacterales bacterium SAG-MED20]|nr:hypothetical protein [Pelagibacterales bacterium SAG-MED20]
MDEEITIIDANTRNQKIKSFFINNRKNLIIITSIIVILLVGYLSLGEIKKRDKAKLANQYNIAKINFKIGEEEKITEELINIVNKQDVTYSPLALYFIIDNNLIDNKEDVNSLFDILIKDTKLQKEIKDLIIYKKALYNSDFISENELIQILNPIINSKSVWKSHSLYLIAEYFYSRNEKQKAKEFFNQILDLTNSNSDIREESQKRINRDFSE